MKKAFLVAWLLLPAAAAAYHYGPGQDRLRADQAAEAVSRARAAVARSRAESEPLEAQEHWTVAEAAWAEALQVLPKGAEHEALSLRLEQAKAGIECGKLPTARRDLESLLASLEAGEAADPALLADARRTLAHSQYYMTWLMRLEGAQRTEWEPEVEAARQNYRLVAEQATSRGDTQLAQLAQQDLEASIRLARMELQELQGLPLPSQ